MNAVQEAIATVRQTDDGNPDQALLLSMLVLRGGQSSADNIEADACLWQRMYGQPSWETLDAWAAAMEIEAGIGNAMIRARRQSQV